MNATLELPLPQLVKGRFAFTAEDGCSEAGALTAYSDPALFDACGVRVAFPTRAGGVSAAPFDALNLGIHVNDDPHAVAENRRRVQSALGAADLPLLVPNQIHGSRVRLISPDDACNLDAVRADIAEGADALAVAATDVAALLCYADCVPVILVAPSGAFAVVHAGWRGVDANIAVKALQLLLEQGAAATPVQVNVYRGPYIHGECFETGPDVYQRFINQFGTQVAHDATHIDLGRALDCALTAAGVAPERIADVDCCTVCDNGEWFSYRAQGGVCGRHGAFAVRRSGADA